MRRLDRYLLHQILLPASLALLVIAFLAGSTEVRDRSATLPGNVISLTDLGYMALLFMPSVVSYVVPAAFFFGILMGLGRLSSQGELTAMAAAGVSHTRIAATIVVLGAGLSLGCLLVQDRVQPWAYHKAFDILEHKVAANVTLDMLEPGIMHEYGGWRVYFASREPSTRALYEVDIVRPDESGAVWIFHARSASMEERGSDRLLILRDGHSVSPENLRSDFDTQELLLPGGTVSTSSRRARMGMTMAGLLESERTISQDFERNGSPSVRIDLLKERREIADRVSLPFAALAVGCLGAPLALGAGGQRRGSRTHLFTVGIGVLLFYYLARALLEPSALADLSEAIVLVWLPNLALIGAGAVLMWRMDHSGGAQ